MAGSKQPPLEEIRPARIALLKPSALGDIVHSLPVLSALRRRYPDAHITWVVNRSFEPLLAGHPDLDATLAFDRGAMREGWWAAARVMTGFLRTMREQQLDLVVDLQGLLRTGLMAWASGAARRVGLSTAREGSRWFYTDVVRVAEPAAMHAVDRYWLAAEALGAGALPRAMKLPLQPAAVTWAEGVLGELPRPWMVVAAGSRWVTKRWLPAHFAALTGRALVEHGGSVVLIGSPDEAALAEEILHRVGGRGRSLVGKTTLPQVAAVVARADVMVANDTGPLHLAVALGRPVVAPYTCSRVSLTGPYLAGAGGFRGGAVQTSVGCQGSLLKRCGRMECMAELTPDRLWPLLHQVLVSWQTSLRSA